VLLLLATLPCVAADGADDDDDPAEFSQSAGLSLQFDKHGVAEVDLALPKAPVSWDGIRTSLAQALHCSPAAFSTPGLDQFYAEIPKAWTGAQRERYVHQVEKANQRQLTGKCATVLQHRNAVFDTNIDYSSFAAELVREGVEQLSITVSFPKSEFAEYTRENLAPLPRRTSAGFLIYQIPLTKDGSRILLLAYGLRAKDLYRAFAVLGGFILAPLMVTFWMRRVALRSDNADPMAARFGFFRTLNWVVSGAMLLWITSGLGARDVIQNWIADEALSRWSALALDVLVLVGPAFVVYFVCIAASYEVDARLRGTGWTRREFLLQQLATVGAQALPLMLLLGGLRTISHGFQVTAVLLLLAFFSFQALQILKVRSMKTFPQALTTGELRDRIFAMGSALGVKVTQIFVLPAGKGAVANAFAAKNKVVIFTDYLLRKLNKREVDAVAAHELAHLRHNHPLKLGLALYAALFLPSYYSVFSGVLTSLISVSVGLLSRASGALPLYPFYPYVVRGMSAFNVWSQRDFVLTILGLSAFYMLSRRFENTADATAVLIARDPEAQITSLLKLSRLNFTPIQWGRTSGTWLTHPSTLRRVKRMAALGGVAPERLREILDDHAAASQTHTAAVGEAEVNDQHYETPAVGNEDAIRTALRRHTARQGSMWGLRLVYIVPPTLLSLVALHGRWEGRHLLIAYGAGVVITAAMVTLAGVWLGKSGYEKIKREVAARFASQNLPVPRQGDMFVGFAPAASPRVYGTQYHWDNGFLVFSAGKLQFVGEESRFAINAADVTGIVIGRGGPSWWKFERVYVRWKNIRNNREEVFNLYPLEPGSMWDQNKRVRALYERMQAWRVQPNAFDRIRPELAELQSPTIGEVTSVSPEQLATFKVNLNVLAMLIPLAAALAVILHADVWYACGTVLAVRFIQWIPLWRYKERPVSFGAVPSMNVIGSELAVRDATASK
jgi:Zn-dependent protease with chaperone function